jgi:hypothetical protein
MLLNSILPRADIHRDEEIGVGEDCRDSIKPPQSSVGVRQQSGEFRAHRHRGVGRQRCRKEGLVALHLFYETACSHNKPAAVGCRISLSENKKVASRLLFYKNAAS